MSSKNAQNHAGACTNYFNRKALKQAQQDAKRIASSNLKAQVQRVLDIVATNPFQNPPPYEKLIGDLAGAYSRRINIQHRLVYQIYDAEHTIKVVRMWTHYD